MQPDFEHLYRSLQLQPGCDVAVFQHAYRRRLSELHPDKGHVRPGPAEPIDLHQLQLLYRRAMAFHAEHGRLPGAPPASERPRDTVFAAAPRPVAAPSALIPAASSESGDGNPSLPARWTGLVLLGILALVLLLMFWPRQEPAPQANPVPGSVLPAAQPVVAEASTSAALDDESRSLHVGMPAVEVTQLLGPPDVEDTEYWWYGSSWVHLKEGSVQSWYSAPLHPLRQVARDFEARTSGAGKMESE